MKIQMGLFSLSLLTLAACSPSSHDKVEDTKVATQSVRSEIVQCRGSRVSSYKYSESAPTKDFTDLKYRTQRTVTTLDGGKTEKSAATGEYLATVYTLDSGSNEQLKPLKISYTYQSTRETRKEDLGGGLFKETTQSKMEKTGRDGYQLHDKDGNPVPTRTYEYLSESTYKVEGNKRIEISNKVDGVMQPQGAYVSYLSQDGVKKIEYSVLEAPFEDSFDGMVITTEKDELFCITEPSK